MTIYFFCAGAMFLDIITGLVLAIKDKNVDSSKMRDGLYKKFANAMCCFIGFCGELGQSYAGLPTIVPTGAMIATVIIMMEMVSILENLCQINPQLLTIMRPYLNKLKSEVDDKDEHDSD